MAGPCSVGHPTKEQLFQRDILPSGAKTGFGREPHFRHLFGDFRCPCHIETADNRPQASEKPFERPHWPDAIFRRFSKFMK
jgi:hypothetical protein